MIKKRPAPTIRGDGTRSGTIRIAASYRMSGEQGGTARFFLSCLYEGVIARVCHLYEQYGDFRNKATDEQDTDADSENRNEQLDSAEHENTFIERKQNSNFIIISDRADIITIAESRAKRRGVFGHEKGAAPFVVGPPIAVLVRAGRRCRGCC